MQSELEPVLLELACKEKLGSSLGLERKKRVAVGDSYIELDGWIENAGTPYALELYSSLEKLKAGQERKLCTDLLRLILVADVVPRKVQGVVVVTAPEAKRWLESGWTGTVLAKFGIKVWLVTLTPAELARLTAARKGQKTGNIST